MIIVPERIQYLNRKPVKQRRCVIYWMQQSQRVEFNHALAFAISEANRLKNPLYVVFALVPDYPEANARHYAFMLEGLQDVENRVKDIGAPLGIRIGHPPDVVVLKVSGDASLVVCDRGYLRHQREWRAKRAASADCRGLQVESDVTVPVQEVSDKAE